MLAEHFYSSKTKKVFLSLSIVLLAFTAINVFSSDNKVLASDPRCPAPRTTNRGDYWGIHTGSLHNNFASLTVNSWIGNRTDGNGYYPPTGKIQGDELDVKYDLNSQLPKRHADGSPIVYHNKPADVPDYLWPDARIFKVDPYDPTHTLSRTQNRWFGTGGKTGDQIHADPYGAFTCPGWDQLGPGSSTQRGNYYVLDCQEKDADGIDRDVRFWISELSNPSGEVGKWGGHWEVTFSINDSFTSPITSNFSSNPMNPNNKYFTVQNGDNARINLIWHPNPPPPPTGAENPRCSQLDVQGSGYYTTPWNGKTWETRTYVRVVDGHGPNYSFSENHVLVQGASGPYSIIGTAPGASKTWTYRAKDLRIKVHIIRKYHHLNGTNWQWDVIPGEDNTTYHTCYDASCSLDISGGQVAGKPDGVRSGGGFTVKATITNNGGPPESTQLWGAIDGRPLILSSTSSPVGFWTAPGEIPKYASAYPPFDVTEPGWNIGHYDINATLYYDLDPAPGIQGGDLVLATCAPTSYDVFKHFSLDKSATVSLSPTAENPTSVTFTGRANHVSLPGELSRVYVDYSATSKREPYGGFPQVVNASGGRAGSPVLYSYTYNPPSNAAGDRYELNPFCVAQLDGWVGPPANNPGNQFSSDTFGGCSSDHAYVFDRPYVHVYGADAIAGGAFKDGDICSPTGGQTIKAYRSTVGGKGGSGTQFAALALGQISGFGSASVRGSGYPHGLSFSNAPDTINIGVPDQPLDGGQYAGQGICSEDFYSTLKKSDATHVTASSINVNALDDNKQSYTDGDITINGGSPFTKQAALFVNGNVYIRGDISYSAGKYLAIIAKGNIYIDNNVYNLDGLYVAQPKDDGSRGTIYTCSQVSLNSASLFDKNDLYDNCGGNDKKQLVVNGAFAAKDVKLLRVANSLRNSCRGEYVTALGGCGASKAAEVFNFSPEIYLFTPVFEENTTSDPYQYITTLPPVL